MERTSLSSKRMAMPRCVARKITCEPSVMRAATNSSSVSMPMAMMPRDITFEKSLSGVFFTVPFCVAKKIYLPSSSRSCTGRMAQHLFARLQVEQALHRLALARRAHVGNLVDLQPVHAAGVGEAEQIGVRRVHDELRDKVLLARLHAHASRAAAPLLAIDRDRRALQVALVAHRHRNLLVGDQVFELDLRALVHNLGAPLVAVLLANLFKLLHDHRAQLLFAAQDLLVLGDLRADLAQLVQDLVDRKLREPVELQFENGVDLPQRQALFLVALPARGRA